MNRAALTLGAAGVYPQQKFVNLSKICVFLS